MRAVVTLRDGIFFANPTGAQGSGILTSMLGANALLVIPAEMGDVAAGDRLVAMMLSQTRTSDRSAGS